MAAYYFQSGEVSSTQPQRARARTGFSFAPSWEAALHDALDDIMKPGVTSPDLVVMFASSAWNTHFQDIVEGIRGETGCRVLIGSSSSGVIAGEYCHESAPGISLMALWLPGATLTPVYLDSIPTEWPWGNSPSVENTRGVLLYSDPYRSDAQATLVALRESCPGVPMVGALASTTQPDREAWIFCDDHVYTRGAVALAIEGPYDLLVRVSQGGTPIGETWTITSVNHNQIHTISNRPAIDVMRDALDEIVAQGFSERDLMIGLPMDEYRDYFEREDFVGRGLLDYDEESGSIMVGAIARQGQSIQFLKRDPILASRDFSGRLHELEALNDVIVAGLLSSCKGRGTNMFGRDDHDAAMVAKLLPEVPVIGLYSLGELGPIRDVPAYSAFAVSLGLILER